MKNKFTNKICLFFFIAFIVSCGQNTTKTSTEVGSRIPKIQNTDKIFTEIEFTTKSNWIFVKVNINNIKGLNFVVDTGVDETIINKRTAEKLNFKFEKRADFKGAFGSDSVFYSENNIIVIENIKIDSLTLVQVPLENLEETFGVTIDGFIGEALFKRFMVIIDFEKEKIQLRRNPDDYIQNNTFCCLDLKIVDKVPVFQTSFIINNNDTLTGDFMIDLGFKNSIAFNSPFIKENELIAKMGKYYVFNAAGILNEKKSYMSRMKKLKFCDYNLDSITYILNPTSYGTLAESDYDGIIGMDILTRFSSVGFDYKNNKMYIGKYIYLKDSVYSDVNCSGLELKISTHDSSVIINAVYKDSPAWEAGLKVGDELKLIKGQEVSRFELAEIKKMLREKGKTIDIQVKRGVKCHNFKLNLRELI